LQGLRQRVVNLSTKLLPVAKSQILVLHRESRSGSKYEEKQAFVVRISPRFVQIASNMYSVVQENELSFAVKALHETDFSYLPETNPAGYFRIRIRGELCVSDEELWLQCVMRSEWAEEEFRTEKIPLSGIVPVELIKKDERLVADMVPSHRTKSFAERLIALQQAEQVIETLTQSIFHIDSSIPNEHLALAERLWLGNKAEGPLSSSRKMMNDLEYYVEAWGESIEMVRSKLCCEILGIEIGDIIVNNIGGKVTRIKLELASLYMTDDSAIHFHLNGRRYRKDGLLGKRDEYIVINGGKISPAK
jgi:hypothetical protein